tara:strand:- start:73 stop:1038 length:966 start_codon:yes stop_codon:yes gene_type:complete
MKIILTERQFRRLKEDSLASTTLSDLSTIADVWERDLDGKYLKRYRRNKKEHVKRVQTMLDLLGYDVGHYGDGEPVIDGIYGPDTAEAVRDFQKDTFSDPIEWDAIVGPITYTELWNEMGELADESDSTVDELIIYGLPDVQDTTPPGEDDDEYEEDDDEYEYEDEYEIDYDYDSDLGDKIVKKAEERLGEPYQLGDEFNGRGGDCSGLIDWVFRNIPELDSPGRETTSSLSREEGLVRGNNNWDETKKGDVLLFDKGPSGYGHTGFVHNKDGNVIDMIHSSGGKGVNIKKDVSKNSYYKRKYMGYIPFEYFLVDKNERMA